VKKTPIQKWNEKIVKHRKKCQQILKLSGNIRYTGVINEYGRTLTGIMNPKVRPLLDPEDVKNEFFLVATMMNLRKRTESAVGKLDYLLLRNNKISVVAFLKENLTFYISFENKEKNREKLIRSIKKLI